MMADELEFTYGIGEGLKVVAVRERSEEKIVLEFNKDLVRREAEDLRNYEFELNYELGRYFRASDLSKNPSVYLYGNGRTVEINLPGNGRKIDIVNLGTGLTALDGNRLDTGARIVDLNINYLEATKATLSKNGELVTVEFNQDLKNQTIDIAGITVGGATVASAEVVKGKLEITLTTAVNSITNVAITAVAKVQGIYDKTAAVASVVAADIVNNRDLSVEVTAELDGSELTIDIVLNKAIDAKQEEDVDVLINNKFFKTLGKANRTSSTTYQFVVADKADAEKVRVVGLKLNGEATVVIKEIPVNKEALTTAITGADAKVETDYTTESWTAFQAALTAAKDMPETTQEEVDAKVAAINDAIRALEAKPEEPVEYTLTAVRFIDGVLGDAVRYTVTSDLEDAAKYKIILTVDNEEFESEVLELGVAHEDIEAEKVTIIILKSDGTSEIERFEDIVPTYTK